MTTLVHDLTAKVLELPSDERAKMLELLIASFEPQSDAQGACASPALKRRADVRSGKVAVVDGAQAMERLRAKIAWATGFIRTRKMSWAMRRCTTQSKQAC